MTALGLYPQMGAKATALVTMSFVCQLEAVGMWRWAVYVATHIGDHRQRRDAVRELLFRHKVRHVCHVNAGFR